MNDTEQQIKEALGLLAERTPHPAPTLNALRRKRKRQRSNIFLLATAGVAAVAVLIFAGVIASDRYVPPNPNDAGAALVPATPGALKYQPHWLPDGFVETFRSARDGQTDRGWVPADAAADGYGGGPSVTLSSGQGFTGQLSEWKEVTVRGLKARAQVTATSALVEWKAQETLVVRVDRVGHPESTALRVADSVRADSDAVFQAPFKVKDKPATTFSGTGPDDWSAQYSPGRGPYEVTVSKREPDFRGAPSKPVTARGKQAMIVGGGTVVVQEGDLWITVTNTPADKPDEEIAAVADDVEIASGIDTSWIRK
ncbi:hypothetical protein JNUCC0626_39005 [Lentzea sp. JNUCC 0626]|uniref:hypothetical protein n=1 Tax=Lentzea sp. JNUCC 0626 TaxID=3367513 RepID=UPI003749BDD5